MSRWPYSTRKVVIGAMAGVVEHREQIVESLGVAQKADHGVKLGTNT